MQYLILYQYNESEILNYPDYIDNIDHPTPHHPLQIQSPILKAEQNQQAGFFCEIS